MPFNGSGTFLRVMDWEADRDAGIKIRADRHDQEDDNFADGLSNVITKDGQTQPTANIPMNGKKLVNLGAPTDGTDAATKAYADGIKVFLNDIFVTKTVWFRDGTTTRGKIEADIGAGVPAQVVIEANSDTGALVNRLSMSLSGIFALTGGINAPGQFATKQSFVIMSGSAVNRMNLTAEVVTADGYASMACLSSTGVEQGRVAVNKDSVMGRGTTAWDIINDTNERLRMREETSFGAAAYHKISLFDNNGVHDYSEEWTAGVKRYYNAQAMEFRTITGVQRGEFRFNHGTALSELYLVAYNGSGVAERAIHVWGGNILFTNTNQAMLTKNANGSGGKAAWRTDFGNVNGWTALSALNDAGAITATISVDIANAMWTVEGVGSYRLLSTRDILSDTSDVNTGYGIGEEILVYTNSVVVNRNSVVTPCLSATDSRLFRLQGQPNASTVVPGQWRARGMMGSDYVLAKKVAN